MIGRWRSPLRFAVLPWIRVDGDHQILPSLTDQMTRMVGLGIVPYRTLSTNSPKRWALLAAFARRAETVSRMLMTARTLWPSITGR